MTREVFYLSRDRILMTQEPFYLLRNQILIIRCVLYVMHEVTNLSDYAPALSAHKEAPSGFAYFCPRNRKGVSADINQPKTVVRKLRIEVIDRCSDVRPDFFGGFAPDPPLPFLPLIEEKETKEDQGDDRHQVGWMGTGIYLGLRGVLPNRRRKLFGPSWSSAE